MRGILTVGLPVLLVSVVSLGCGDDTEQAIEAEPTATHDEAPPEPAEPAEGQAPEGEALAEVDDPSFLLRATASGPYTAGALGRFGISLTPKGVYHVNQEYPISVELTAPEGVSFAKTTLERADCAEFGERAARFDVPFTPASAGDHRVQAKVSFAVCTPENCVPDERTLAVVLPVE